MDFFSLSFAHFWRIDYKSTRVLIPPFKVFKLLVIEFFYDHGSAPNVWLDTELN